MKQIASSKLTWLAMAAIIVALLVIGSIGDSGPRSNAERARDVAGTIKCPTCRSQSAADSDAPAARSIRTEIARRIDAGESDESIRNYFASQFTEEILLTPSASGLTGLVWALPAAALVSALLGLGIVLRRWQTRDPREATDDDRKLVGSFLAGSRPDGHTERAAESGEQDPIAESP